MRPLMLLLCVSATGCLRLLATPVPMQSAEERLADDDGRARCLLVFLPGVADRAGTFHDKGFIEELRARRLSVDVISADATIGYYLRGTDAQRLERDIVRHARGRGYEQIWMAGVSMGGFGTLHYAAQYPGSLDGIVTLAPHLGEETVLQTIRDAGGLAHWTPPPVDPYSRLNHTEQVWRWLYAMTMEARHGPQVYVGYGENDPLTGRAELLADALPRRNVLHVAGGHTWTTWKKLWTAFLDRSDFKDRCAMVPTPPGGSMAELGR